MSFDLPDNLNLNDYSFEERAFIKMGNVLHILKKTYPLWSFKVESASHCSVVIRLPDYSRYRYNCYDDFVFCIGRRTTKTTLDQHLQYLDTIYQAKFPTSITSITSPPAN
jgi:hypothetical protein